MFVRLVFSQCISSWSCDTTNLTGNAWVVCNVLTLNMFLNVSLESRLSATDSAGPVSVRSTRQHQGNLTVQVRKSIWENNSSLNSVLLIFVTSECVSTFSKSAAQLTANSRMIFNVSSLHMTAYVRLVGWGLPAHCAIPSLILSLVHQIPDLGLQLVKQIWEENLTGFISKVL